MTAGNKLTSGTAIVDDILFVGGGKVPQAVAVALTAAGTHAAGDMLSWENPEGTPILITDFTIYVTTGVGTITADIGVAADGTTASDTILDAVTLGTAQNGLTLSMAINGGTNGGTNTYMAAREYITGDASLATTGLVATAYITYVKL
jgi:hypothetical protein